MKDWLKNVVFGISVVIVMVAVVFVVLNWPSFWKRVSFLGRSEVRMESNEVVAVGQEKTEFVQDSLIMESVIFPELFISDDILKIKKEYQGRYPNNYLVIPSLEVAAPIVYLNDVSDGVLQDKLKQGVGHYPGTAMPGEVGNSFIFGHSSYYWWDWSEYNSVFANLESIAPDALVLLYYNDSVYVYRVNSTVVVSPTDFSVLEQGKDRELSLMTCTPLGTNINRFVVKAELIS